MPRRVAQAVVVGHGEVRDAREKHELVGTRVAREGRGHDRRPPMDVQPIWPPDETQPPKSPNKWAPAGELHHGHPKWDSTLMCRPSIKRVSRASALYTPAPLGSLGAVACCLPAPSPMRRAIASIARGGNASRATLRSRSERVTPCADSGTPFRSAGLRPARVAPQRAMCIARVAHQVAAAISSTRSSARAQAAMIAGSATPVTTPPCAARAREPER